jgi:hypothetical protein
MVQILFGVASWGMIVLLLPRNSHRLKEVLVDLREALPHFVTIETEKVNDHDSARYGGQVTTISVGTNMLLKPCPLSQAQLFGYRGLHDKPRAMQFHAGRAQSVARAQIRSSRNIHAHRQVCVDPPNASVEFDLRLVRIELGLTLHLSDDTIASASAADSHSNADRRMIFRRLRPRMVWDSHEQGNWTFRC